MSIWSLQPPTTPGRYWVRNLRLGVSGAVHCFPTVGEQPAWATVKCDAEYGPRVPDAEELAEITEKAAMFDLMAAGNLTVTKMFNGTWIAVATGSPVQESDTRLGALRLAYKSWKSAASQNDTPEPQK